MTHKTAIALTFVAALASCAIITAANARSPKNERACEHYRDEHPAFRGAFQVTAHKAVWNGSGFDDEPREFTCSAEPGGEGLPPMRIEKTPSRGRH